VPDALAFDRIAVVRERDWAQHAALRVSLGGGVLVLVHDQSVAGFCEFGPTEDADGDSRSVGHIMRVYVHPIHQSLGGGKLLVEAACVRLAESGYNAATLWTLESEVRRGAHGFYSQLGWTLEDVHSAEDPPDIRYRRRLP